MLILWRVFLTTVACKKLSCERVKLFEFLICLIPVECYYSVIMHFSGFFSSKAYKGMTAITKRQKHIKGGRPIRLRLGYCPGIWHQQLGESSKSYGVRQGQPKIQRIWQAKVIMRDHTPKVISSWLFACSEKMGPWKINQALMDAPWVSRTG